MKTITCRSFNKANGYWELFFSDGSRMWEHRYVMEQAIGRQLCGDEIVHHRNEIKTDNRLENLELTTRSLHSQHHRADPSAYVVLTCTECGISFSKTKSYIKTKQVHNNKQKNFFCSRSCSGSYNRRKQLAPVV